MASQLTTKITEEAHLRLERAAEYKSEYVGGEIFAMSGGSPKHSLLAANWSRELGNQLRGGRCVVFNSDLRVRTESTGSYVYPGVSVVCGKVSMYAGSDDIVLNPKVVVEVLSPSTANYDRSEKFDLYGEIPSLAEYVLMHQDVLHVEHFARQLDSSWIFRDYKGEASTISLDSIQCSIRLGDVYSELPS